MRLHYHTVRAVARRISDAIDRSVKNLVTGQVEQEPAMTDRMLGRIEAAVDGYEHKGIKWKAKTLTDRGRGAQESEFGADFLGALNIDLPEYSVSKGFLAQAKIEGRANRRELVDQCERMLNLSSHSYVFIYSKTGVRVMTAISIVAAQGAINDVYHQTARSFFEDHLKCSIGDRSIKSATPGQLADLKKEFLARSGILIEGEAKG